METATRICGVCGRELRPREESVYTSPDFTILRCSDCGGVKQVRSVYAPQELLNAGAILMQQQQHKAALQWADRITRDDEYQTKGPAGDCGLSYREAAWNLAQFVKSTLTIVTNQ